MQESFTQKRCFRQRVGEEGCLTHVTFCKVALLPNAYDTFDAFNSSNNPEAEQKDREKKEMSGL